MCSGYLCFVFSIFWIGVLTAVIGDLASHFGCTVGLQDGVTAITFVALGTSVPGTYRSSTDTYWRTPTLASIKDGGCAKLTLAN